MGSERAKVDIEKLGRYDIVRILGKGAMGVVYEGRDPNLDRRVAIKTIRVQNLSREAAIEYDARFRTEARSAARLHHPNIVSVFDSGQDAAISYLVMEFIQGDDLKHHLDSGMRFSIRASIAMVHDLLMALDHAHRQNVVHRDIKPANMLIELGGRVKLTDFGVARIQDPDETNLTQVGGAVGTPKYMSPEQAKGQRGDSRSDVFSAGVVLYELLTGKQPFEGDNQFVVIHQIVNLQAQPPSELNPSVPAAMDEVMARAMAKNPDERYATAREFALALRTVAQLMASGEGAQGADVAAELAQFMVGQETVVPAALRDGSSTGIFGPSVDTAMVTTVNHEIELADWNKIKDSVDPQDFKGYLERFPTGIYARRAQLRLDQLVLGPASVQTSTGSANRPQSRVKETLNSTPRNFASTVPFDGDEPLIPASAPKVDMPSVAAVAKKKPRPQERKNTVWYVMLGGAMCGLVIALLMVLRLNTGQEAAGRMAVASAPTVPVASAVPQVPPSVPVQALPAQPPVQVASAEEVILTPPPATPASKPAKAAVAATVTPAHRPTAAAKASQQGASAPQNVAGGAPHPVVAAKPKSVTPPPVAAPDVVVQHEAPAAQAVSLPPGEMPGPTQPGQACAGKSFFARIPCLAHQCRSDKYRDSQECVHYRSLERNRDDRYSNRK